MAHIYFKMSENSPVDNINRVENPWSQKLSCQTWQPSKLLVKVDLHRSLDELNKLGKLTVSVKVGWVSEYQWYLSPYISWSRENKGKAYLLPNNHQRMESTFIPSSENGDFFFNFFIFERRLLAYI